METMTDQLKAYGLLAEIISWKLRVFVRTRANGPGVFAKVLVRYPIERVMRGRRVMPRDACDLAHRLPHAAEAVCRRRAARCSSSSRGRSIRRGAAGKWTDAATGEHGDLLDVTGRAAFFRLPLLQMIVQFVAPDPSMRPILPRRGPLAGRFWPWPQK